MSRVVHATSLFAGAAAPGGGVIGRKYLLCSCRAGRKGSSASWVSNKDLTTAWQSDRNQIAFVQAVASTMTKIALHDPAQHETLTEASWQPVKTLVVDKIARGMRWLRTLLPMGVAWGSLSPEEQTTGDLLAECKQQLWTLMHVLLIHHLPNRQLDMSEVINTVLAPAIQDFGLIDSSRASSALAFAMLKRASEDKAVFAHSRENDRIWASVRRTVSNLWAISCK